MEEILHHQKSSLTNGIYSTLGIIHSICLEGQRDFVSRF